MLYPKYRHSASGGNMFIECQSAFLWRYGFENWGGDNERTAMGNAAEWAAWQGILEDLPEKEIRKVALKKFDELRQGEIGERRDGSADIAVQFVKALKPLGKPLAYQPWQGVYLDELEKQISIKVDLSYPDCDVDLKATLKIPSIASPPHIRQQGLYCGARQKPARILYASPKRFSWYEVSRCDAVKGATEILTAFEMIERWDGICPDPRRATLYMPINTDSFYWSDAKDVQRASELWSKSAAPEQLT